MAVRAGGIRQGPVQLFVLPPRLSHAAGTALTIDAAAVQKGAETDQLSAHVNYKIQVSCNAKSGLKRFHNKHPIEKSWASMEAGRTENNNWHSLELSLRVNLPNGDVATKWQQKAEPRSVGWAPGVKCEATEDVWEPEHVAQPSTRKCPRLPRSTGRFPSPLSWLLGEADALLSTEGLYPEWTEKSHNSAYSWARVYMELLDSMNLGGPFQLRMVYDSLYLWRVMIASRELGGCGNIWKAKNGNPVPCNSQNERIVL